MPFLLDTTPMEPRKMSLLAQTLEDNYGYRYRRRKKKKKPKEKKKYKPKPLTQEQKKRRKDYTRKKRLEKEYGITPEEFNNMLLQQRGKCAICGILQSATGKFLHVDHCHKTGKIRGLLCHKCNYALGFLRDSIEIAEAAIEYLKHEGPPPLFISKIRRK
jgi:hypothetical protein